MSDLMTFPKTVDEFMEKYKIVDSDEVYTNGAELVPIFRMKQWFEHADVEPKHAHVIVDEDGNMECSNCGSSNCFDNYCGHCGAKLIGERKDEGEDADELWKHKYKSASERMDLNVAYIVENSPTVDAESVRHGHWTNISVSVTGSSSAECSLCGTVVHDTFADVNRINYCPNCGAKMDEVIEDA